MSSLRVGLVDVTRRLPHDVGGSRQRWSERRWLRLELTDAQGRKGLGEAAPLPGYSPDTLDACRAALEQIDFDPIVAAADAGAVLRAVDMALPAALPAARCCVATAALDLLGQRRTRPLWQLFADVVASASSTPPDLPVAWLLDAADPALTLASAEAGGALGFRTFKLKLGRPGRFAEELASAAALRRMIGDERALRLDVNRSWSPGDARAHLAALAPLRPELVEEPVPAAALPELGVVPVPLALDESLVDHDPDRQLPHAVRVLVLKPTLLGFGRCADLARRARERALGVVVSHTFDGPAAFAAAGAFAFALGPSPLAHGLAAHAALGPREPSPRIERSDVPGLGPLPELDAP